MFSSLKKKTKALGIWHSKAMLVDPKKTKITIVGSETADLFEDRRNPNAVFVLDTVGTEDASEYESAEYLAILAEVFGT